MAGALGGSTKPIEDARGQSLVKVFNDDARTCYDKTLALLKKMPNISVYAETGDMIAVYWKRINTTPVGVYFTQVDASRTKVEVASPSTTGKEWVAKNIFGQKVLEEAPLQQFD